MLLGRGAKGSLLHTAVATTMSNCCTRFFQSSMILSSDCSLTLHVKYVDIRNRNLCARSLRTEPREGTLKWQCSVSCVFCGFCLLTKKRFLWVVLMRYTFLLVTVLLIAFPNKDFEPCFVAQLCSCNCVHFFCKMLLSLSSVMSWM